jgi:nucleoid DNA-binding protein
MNKSDLTGKNIDVRPKKLPFFKVGKDLKKTVDTKEM